MAGRYMIDTDTCSFAIRSNPEGIREKFWEHRGDEICISVITCAELTFGGIHRGSPKLEQLIKRFISRLGIVDFAAAAAAEYARIREYLETNGETIGNLDMLIAAGAKSSNAILVTNNTRHFSRVPGLRLENWTVAP
jgi:tRNA(fMet)-specific endonuclease VapC